MTVDPPQSFLSAAGQNPPACVSRRRTPASATPSWSKESQETISIQRQRRKSRQTGWGGQPPTSPVPGRARRGTTLVCRARFHRFFFYSFPSTHHTRSPRTTRAQARTRTTGDEWRQRRSTTSTWWAHARTHAPRYAHGRFSVRFGYYSSSPPPCSGASPFVGRNQKVVGARSPWRAYRTRRRNIIVCRQVSFATYDRRFGAALFDII